MYDVGFSLAPFMAVAAQREREQRFEDRRWLRQLRESRRRARRAARERTVIIGKPSHLAGIHRL